MDGAGVGGVAEPDKSAEPDEPADRALLQYDQVPCSSWTVRSIGERQGVLVAVGLCPRCTHDTDVSVGYVVRGVLPVESTWPERTDLCRCGRNHPGRPPDASDDGCGAYWLWTPVRQQGG